MARRIVASTVFLGFACAVVQIVALREILVALQVNELGFGLILASWLFWMGVGALAGQSVGRRLEARALPFLWACAGLAIAAFLPLARALRPWASPGVGELIGLPRVSLACALVILPVGLGLGALFPCLVRALAKAAPDEAARAPARVYLAEVGGFALGGALYRFLLVGRVGAVAVFTLLACLCFAAAAVSARQRLAGVLCLAAGLVLFASAVPDRWDRAMQGWRWSQGEVVAARSSRFGDLVVTRLGEQLNLFENGQLSTTVPDPSSAELLAHLTLATHPAPRRILLVGGALGGTLAEVLRHPVEHVDCCELDPVVVETLRPLMKREWLAPLKDPRVSLRFIDGRLFLKQTSSRYDAILIDMGDPANVMVNRYYTEEFGRLVATRLAPGGLAAFTLSFSESYMGPQMRALNVSFYKALTRAFGRIRPLAGGPVLYLCAAGPPSGDRLLDVPTASVIRARLAARRIEPRYLHPGAIVERFSIARLADALARDLAFREQHLPDRARAAKALAGWVAEAVPANRDYDPVSYRLTLELWLSAFARDAGRVFESLAALPWLIWALALVGLGVLVGCLGRSGRPRLAVGYGVFVTGLCGMGVDLVALFSFQIVHGFVLNEVGLLAALFMGGILVGGRWEGGRPSASVVVETRRILVQEALFLCLLLTCWALVSLGVEGQAYFALLGVVLVAGGFLVGARFPLAARYFGAVEGNAYAGEGTVYALDLFGACFGSLVIVLYLLPVYAFSGLLAILACAKLGAALAVVLSTKSP